MEVAVYALQFCIIPCALLLLVLILDFGSKALAEVEIGSSTQPAKKQDMDGADDDPWKYRSDIEQVFWSVMLRLATRAGVTVVVTVFCALVAWMSWIIVHHLSGPWMVAYFVLAFLGFCLMTTDAKRQPAAMRIATLFVVLCLVWVLLHVFGLTHVSIPPIHIPRIGFTIP